MKIEINGKENIISRDSVTMSELLKIANVENPEMVSIQLNGEFIAKEKIGTTNVRDKDKVDFLYFMGGGRSIEKESHEG